MPELDTITRYEVRIAASDAPGPCEGEYYTVSPTEPGYDYDPTDANSALVRADAFQRSTINAWVVEITETKLVPPAGLEMS